MTPILLCLHGWGGSKESFTEMRQALADTDLEIISPDLPGFGAQAEPTEPWSVMQYAEWVEKMILSRHTKEELLQRGFFLLGHSHGGRISIMLTANKMLPVTHLFLCASAGIKRPRHIKRIIGLTLAKTGKFFLSIPLLNKLEPLGKKFLYKLVGVHDYEQASPLMRETLIKVTAEDLRPLLPKIRVPTDIFWGEQDGMTPVQDAYLMKKLIVGSTLTTFAGVRHGVHREKAREIAEVIKGVIKK